MLASAEFASAEEIHCLGRYTLESISQAHQPSGHRSYVFTRILATVSEINDCYAMIPLGVLMLFRLGVG